MKKRILAVDDEPSITRLISATLTARGHEVSIAHSGQDALDAVALQKPDLVVLDIMMPRMDGREVRRRLRTNPATKDTPVLFVSAVGDLNSQLDALEEAPADYMTKPFDPRELGDYVDALLDPSKKETLDMHRNRQVGQLRKFVEVMRHKREE